MAWRGRTTQGIDSPLSLPRESRTVASGGCIPHSAMGRLAGETAHIVSNTHVRSGIWQPYVPSGVWARAVSMPAFCRLDSHVHPAALRPGQIRIIPPQVLSLPPCTPCSDEALGGQLMRRKSDVRWDCRALDAGAVRREL
jgi:hypothetical protein